VSNSEMPRLGRGLEALIPKTFMSSGKTITQIPTSSIVANEFQPRLSFDNNDISELARSIKTHGLAQPIIVRKKGDGYELVAGERRFRACILTGMTIISAIVRELSDKESLELALVENLDRKELTPIERAKAFKRLADEFKMSHQEVGERFGKSRAAITNSLRLLQLSLTIQDAIEAREISEGHARALLAVDSEEMQMILLKKIRDQDLTVRDIEKIVQEPKAKTAKKKTNQLSLFPEQDTLSEKLAVKVKINGTKQKGYIKIPFSSEKEYNKIINCFT